jgi:hypothetical protein
VDNTSIVLIVLIVAVVFVIWILRDRITAFTARGSMEKREGEVKLEATPGSQTPNTPSRASVNITRTKTFGDTKMKIERDDVNVDDNVFTGKTDLQVKDESKKSRK